MKVDRELQEAIKKHGEVRLPKSFEDNFKERILSEKNRIAHAWITTVSLIVYNTSYNTLGETYLNLC